MSNPIRKPLDLGALSALATEVASTVAVVGGDIALVIGPDGVIRTVAEGMGTLAHAADAWVGRPWAETVTADTRRKVEKLLQEVQADGVARRREVNHPSPAGADIPVSYSAVRLGEDGPVLAVGRDLRAVAAIQQRFVDAQRDMESDYWSRRQADNRFRLLFQVLNDAVLLLDASTLEVVEANAAAETLFGSAAGGLTGTQLPDRVELHSRAALTELLGTARTLGRPAEMRVRSGDPVRTIEVSATPFRSESQQLLLVRARDTAQGIHADAGPLDDHRRLVKFVQQTPDGVVITDTSGRVLMANPAFASFCGVLSERELRGLSLDALLGDSQDQWTDLLGRARQRGIVIHEGVNIATEDGPVTVDTAAAMLAEGDQECVGFSLRLHRPAAAGSGALDSEVLAALSGLARQAGRLPLSDMLTEVQFIAERFLVDRALRAADGALDAAARSLGLTVEGLELRMRRHRLQPVESPQEKHLLN